MKPTRIMVCIFVAVYIALFCGCAKKDNDVNFNNTNSSNLEVKSDNTNNSNQDVRIIEAKKVIEDYLISLKDSNTEISNKFCTDHAKAQVSISIKDTNLINITEDKGEKYKSDYLNGRGTITKPYDVLCFLVTYNIQYEDEKKATEPSGEKQKWFTLIKETKTSTWNIDEIGY